MKREGRKLNHKTLEELRRLTVRRVLEDHESPRQVAADFGFCRNYLYSWLTRFKAGGEEALSEKIAAGPKPKLTERQRQQVRRWVGARIPGNTALSLGCGRGGLSPS